MEHKCAVWPSRWLIEYPYTCSQFIEIWNALMDPNRSIETLREILTCNGCLTRTVGLNRGMECADVLDRTSVSYQECCIKHHCQLQTESLMILEMLLLLERLAGGDEYSCNVLISLISYLNGLEVVVGRILRQPRLAVRKLNLQILVR